MVVKERPDIVIIALPHHLHEPCAVWCAKQGCHLLLEKPMALNLAECDAILEAVAASNVKLMVGHTQHYRAANLQAKELITSGRLGKLIAIHDTRHVYYYDEGRPAWFFEKEKAGGGILMNLGAHSIDKIQWLTGSRVKSVRASLSYEGAFGDVEGSGCILLQTTSNVTAVIIQSGYEGVAKDETELIFSNGMAKLISAKGLWVSKGGQYEQVQSIVHDDPFVMQFKDLLQAIQYEQDPDSSGKYARSVITVLEAVYHSDEKGVEISVEPK
ncbi:Glucose--fructose oxidoreductase precursor [compost metagenome]